MCRRATGWVEEPAETVLPATVDFPWRRPAPPRGVLTGCAVRSGGIAYRVRSSSPFLIVQHSSGYHGMCCHKVDCETTELSRGRRWPGTAASFAYTEAILGGRSTPRCRSHQAVT